MLVNVLNLKGDDDQMDLEDVEEPGMILFMLLQYSPTYVHVHVGCIYSVDP